MQNFFFNVMKNTTIKNEKMILIDLLTAFDCLLLNKDLSAFKNKYKKNCFIFSVDCFVNE